MINKNSTAIIADFDDDVSVDEMCKVLHIGKSTGYMLLSQNRIKQIKVGKKYSVPKSSIIDFITIEAYNENTFDVAAAEKGATI